MQLNQEHDPADVVAVANAVLACKRGDPLGSALALALFSTVLLEDADEGARTMLGLVLLSFARELDPDLFSLLRWH